MTALIFPASISSLTKIRSSTFELDVPRKTCLLLVFIVSLIASQFTGDFEFVLSGWNMFLGTAIAAVIGLISGILPAIKASKLDPVEAIRTGM